MRFGCKNSQEEETRKNQKTPSIFGAKIILCLLYKISDKQKITNDIYFDRSGFVSKKLHFKIVGKRCIHNYA